MKTAASSYTIGPRSLVAMIGVLALNLVLFGCGDTHRSHGVRGAAALKPKFAFWSPALAAGGIIPAGYACETKIWLPLRWSDLPGDTRELALYVGSFGAPKAVGRGQTISRLAAGAGVVGLRPASDGLAAGALPDGAAVLSDARVPACPPRTPGQQFTFRLFALSGADRITQRTLNSRAPGELLAETGPKALAIGEFTASYN